MKSRIMTVECPNAPRGFFARGPSHEMVFEGVTVDEAFRVKLRARCVDCGTVVEQSMRVVRP